MLLDNCLNLELPVDIYSDTPDRTVMTVTNILLTTEIEMVGR
jgi:hypothetical protein